MVLDGLRGYIQLASGLTDVTRERAMAAAKSLLAQGEAGAGIVVPPAVRSQVGALTDDLLATSRANRDLLLNLVRAEVERSVARLGLVSGQELSAATRRSQSLERRVEELEEELHRSRSGGSAKKSTAKKSAAKKSTAKKSTAKKSAAKRSTAKKSAATTDTATSAPAQEPASTTTAAAPSESA
jgi:hypothetical protein